MYKNIDQIPDDDKPLMKRLLNMGVIDVNQEGEFQITENMLEILRILSRCGIV